MNTGLTFKSVKCREVGHIVKDCERSRFKSRIPLPPKENLEAGKPVHDAATAEHDAATTEHDAAIAEHDAAAGEHDAAAGEHNATTAEHNTTGNAGENVTSASSDGSGNDEGTTSWD